MGQIHDAYLASFTPRDPAPAGGQLWASDLGACRRKTILRVLGVLAPPPDQAALARFENGTALERSTIYRLTRHYEERLVRSFKMETERWVGTADAVLDAFGDIPTIIEHKATDSRWWDYGGKLPETSHLLQLGCYGELFYQLHQRRPVLVLYYRAWGHYAEFSLRVLPDALLAEGEVDGERRVVERKVSLHRLMAELEDDLARLPDGWVSRVPGNAIPPRLDDPERGCMFRGRPSCPYYAHCWPEDGVGLEGVVYDDAQDVQPAGG